jgi:curved DNA-binding protein CbpA
MTDYFALLDQPRRPWLDPEELKQVFHQKSLEAHPDAQTPSDRDQTFTQLNEAYQVLREPKRRLHHLLSLEGAPPGADNVSVPENIERLFPMVAALIQESESIMRKLETATNALSRSLVRPNLLRGAESMRQMLQTLEQLYGEAIHELQTISDSRTSGSPEHRAQLEALYLRFSYLTKWTSELRERE